MKDSVPEDTNADVSKKAGASQKHSHRHKVTVKLREVKKSSAWYVEMYGDTPG